MIIYPEGHLSGTFADAVAGLNRAPKPGDEGHTDDHGRLSKILFDVPQEFAVGAVMKDGGQWQIMRALVDEDFSPSTFAEVRDFLGRVGIAPMANAAHAAADGSTDWTEDGEALDGISVTAFASGVVGLTHLVNILMSRT